MDRKWKMLGRSSGGANPCPDGMTLLELITILSIVSLLAIAAVPSALRWFSDYRLKSAALDLFTNFQLARMRAIQDGTEYGIVFSAVSGEYRLVSGGENKRFEGAVPGSDDVVEKAVSLRKYGGGICYGHGRADRKATVSGGTFQAGDEISYRDDMAEFNAQGMSNRMGYVYLKNDRESAYAVSTPTLAGVVNIKRWDQGQWR